MSPCGNTSQLLEYVGIVQIKNVIIGFFNKKVTQDTIFEKYLKIVSTARGRRYLNMCFCELAHLS